MDARMKMEMGESSGAKKGMSSMLATPSMFPGFRFSPTDEELISYYLKKKIQGSDKCVEVISEVEICKFEPWDLPCKAVIQSQNEWFFFSPRGRKYPNGSQSKRATRSGYWKATGKERNVKSGSHIIGTKRTLVFHTGRAPKGERTEWKMHEYCLRGNSQDSFVVCRLRKSSDFHLNDTPRKNSLDRRLLSTGNDVNSASPAVNIEQMSGFEEAKSVNECSQSHNSHSVEQVNSESEFEQRVTNEFSQHDSSSHQDCDYEDDCFADIMKDDIIKLDESSLPETPDHRSMVARESEAEKNTKQPLQSVMSGVLPFQGTANRRIRLHRPKAKYYPPKTSKAFHDVVSMNYPAERVTQSSQQSPKCWTSTILSNIRANHRSMSAFLVILTLLFLFLSLLVGSWQLNRFIYFSF